MLSDKGFRERVCAATHALSWTVDVDRAADGVRVRINRVMPAEVPDFVKRLVGETLEVSQDERWSAPDATGARSGTVRVQISGQPAEMNGTLRLEAAGAGSRQLLSGEVRVRLPFLGRKVEPEITKGIVAAMRKEGEVGKAWLAAG